MIIKCVEIEKFRAFENTHFSLGKRITVIAGRNATQKTTLLGMIGQPFTIGPQNPMHGCKTIDGYNFRSQFRDKFKISEEHDKIGEHKWKLIFHPNVNDKDYFSIKSIPRTQRGSKTTLRFWNAESRTSGAGYVQLPVYYLSLSRLFPIGESGKTTPLITDFSNEEIEYCIRQYSQILSIQNVKGPTIEVKKSTSTRTFSGVNDEIHDILTNSAGEANITRIILAILSFKRLKEQYPSYKGGILLIDEIDATLYSYSQFNVIDFLYNL